MSQQIYRFIKFLEKKEKRTPPIKSVLKYGDKDDFTEEVQLKIVKDDWENLKNIIDKGINPSEDIKLAAVRENGLAIKYIENPSEDVQLAAVQNYVGGIRIIIEKGINPSEDVQLAAVNHNGFAIKYIKNPSEKVQLAAVRENGFAINYIENLTPIIKNASYQWFIKNKGDIPKEYEDYFN